MMNTNIEKKKPTEYDCTFCKWANGMYKTKAPCFIYGPYPKIREQESDRNIIYLLSWKCLDTTTNGNILLVKVK